MKLALWVTAVAAGLASAQVHEVVSHELGLNSSEPQTPEDPAAALYNDALDLLQKYGQPEPRSAGPHKQVFSPSRAPKHLRKTSGFLKLGRYLAKESRRLLSSWGVAEIPDIPGQQTAAVDSDQLALAKRMLDEAADLGSHDALYLLGDMHLFGNYSTPRDMPAAVTYYDRLASHGNASAQFMVGLAYSTGLFGTVPIDQAKASLYYTFAAHGGDARAQMAMGFRSIAAIASPPDYEKAYDFYRMAGDQSLKYFLDGPGPLGRKHLSRNSFVIADEFFGGVYGQGASQVSSGPEAERHRSRHSYNFNSFEGILEFDQYAGDESSLVLFALAFLFYQGGIYSEPDYKASFQYAMRGAAQLWYIDTKMDGSTFSPVTIGPDGSLELGPGEEATRPLTDPEEVHYAAACAGFLGERYLRGEGVEQNSNAALSWFLRGAAFNHTVSLNGLGMMYMMGIEVDMDVEKATAYLERAATSGIASARFNLARIYRARGDAAGAMELIRSAADSGNFESMHLLALSIGDPNSGNGDGLSYEDAVYLLKQLSERVEDFHSPMRWAQQMYREKDEISALLGFLICAEQGYESAQVNVAFIIDNARSYLDTGDSHDWDAIFPNASLNGLMYWTRSAKQINTDAQVKMGDYYLGGVGALRSPEKAAACYNSAADRGNSQARWNLGWMHENGIGVEKDYHLAKRYYDLALESAPEAYFPVKLSLLQLYAKGYWNSLTGGKIRGIMGDARPKLSMKEQWNLFWKRWNEMEFKLWDDEDELSALFAGISTGDLDWENVEDDLFLEVLVTIGLFCFTAVVMWYRRRQQQEQQRLEQARRAQEAVNAAGQQQQN